MKALVRKFGFLLILAGSMVALAYTLVLYARHEIHVLPALLSMKMAVLSMLWFGFQLGEAEEDWPLSIRPANRPVRAERERNVDWTLCEQNAA